MGWTWTGDPSAFVAAVGPLLDADPVRHTLAVSQVHLRPQQAHFGVWTGPGGPGGAIHSPPFPVLPVVVPDPAIAPLVEAWPAGADAVVGDPALAAQIAAVWCAATGGRAVLSHAERLHRLESLHEPPPCAGTGRLMTETDVELAAPHLGAFSAEARVPAPDDPAELLRTRLQRGGAVLLWTVDGELVALAGVSAPALRQVRIGPVWTSPQHRRRGYGAAVTAAATLWALEHADEVLLYTDLANPTSNALYRRLGYTGLCDLLQLDLERP